MRSDKEVVLLCQPDFALYWQLRYDLYMFVYKRSIYLDKCMFNVSILIKKLLYLMEFLRIFPFTELIALTSST